MSQRSRADSPRRPTSQSPMPHSALTVPSTPPALGDVTPLALSGDEAVCPVCLDNFDPTAAGGDARVPFPTCGVHHLHLACLAQFRAQASGPSELLCPLCRHREDVALREMCQRRGVPIPNRISGESTVRAAVPDYAIRTFTSHDAPEPRAPPGVRILCCHHVAAIGRAGGVDFMRLPDRTMRWAPVAVRHEAGIAAWQPSWVCMGCAQAGQLGDLSIPAEACSPCDRCGSTLLWEDDRVTGVEAFGCPQRCAGPARAPAPVLVAPPPQPPAQTLGSGGLPPRKGFSNERA